MTAPSTTLTRRRRLAAAVLAVPLSLAMTGSALATGSTGQAPTSGSGAASGALGSAPAAAPAVAAVSETRAAGLLVPSATGGSPSENAAAQAAAAAADRAAAAKAAADKAAAAQAAERPAPGAAAGSAAGTSARAAGTSARTAGTGGTSVHGSTSSSSKAERPTAPVPGTPSQPLSTADRNGTGANPGETCTHSYCSNGTGLPTGNGVGDGKAVGQPCAGCVGKADNKNPKGQAPDGPTDRNAGYECDRNQGIGQTNPAHTGCTTSTTQPAPPPPDVPPAKKPTAPPKTPQNPQDPGQGTAVMTITVTCSSVSVTSSKDISNVRVFFTNGTSLTYEGLRGTTFSRSYDDGRVVSSATAKSATTTVRGTATGCGGLPTDGSTPPAQTCPDGSPMPPGNKGCVSGTTPGQPSTGGGNVTICHATGSPRTPYVPITVDRNGLDGHGDHAGDIIPMPAGGCPGPGAPPPADACPGTEGIQAPGTTCDSGGGDGGVELCPNGEVMRGGNPASCPTAPPVCPTVMPVTGPVQAGCEPQLPPSHGGGDTSTPPVEGLPIGGVTPGQSAVNPPGRTPPGQAPVGQLPPGQLPPGAVPIGTVTPGQPALNPVPVGPPTGIRPPEPQVITGLSTTAARARAVPSALPFTGTDAMLLVELGALLLLVGGGVAVAARRERAARAA